MNGNPYLMELLEFNPGTDNAFMRQFKNLVQKQGIIVVRLERFERGGVYAMISGLKKRL
jgi:hypothetical protein